MDQLRSPNRRLILLFLLPIIFLTSLFFLVLSFQRSRTQLRAKASIPTDTITGSHGLPGDLWSDIVIGQIDFNQSGPDQVVPFKVFNPGGVIIDRSRRPNTVYIYDGGNSRILVHTSLGVCQNDASIKCTTHSDCPNSQCSFTSVKPADFVIGQPSATSYNGCNGDANMQNYPLRSPARADSLCSIPEFQPSPMEGGSFASMAIDKDHNLYVTDFFNNRVLKYIDPVTTDRIADEVWGQTSMAGNKCNKTDSDIGVADPPPPTTSSLCMGRNQQYQTSFVAGVEIDPSGNLWVADSSNHRVLRFPNLNGTINKTADLVLGQPSFTTRGNGSNPTQMDQPAALRIDPDTGWLYVADKGNNRVSIFKPPFANGIAAQTFGSQFRGPASIDFEASGSGVWISDADNNMLELWDKTQATIQKVLFKDTYQPNGSCGTKTPNFVCKNLQPGGKCWDNMCDVRGSVGIDSDGDIMVAAKAVFNQDIWRFAAPIPSPELGKTISADYRLMYPPNAGYNYPSNKSLWAPRSVVVKNNQLIISDGRKVRFWNNPQDLTNGQAADGYIGDGINSFQDSDPWTIQRIAADNQNHLWVARYSTVDVYQLPLTTGAKPLKTTISFSTGLPVLGGGKISWGFHDQFWGIDVDPTGNYLWLTQVDPIHRVIRVRDPFINPTVDVIIGQKDITRTACNRGLPAAQNDTVCYPGAVKIDRLGNIWVSDHSLEFHGNLRMLMFNASLFTNITNSALFAPPASLISPKMLPWEPAFDSHNRMVVGYNAQLSPSEISRFPGIYNNPIQSLTASVLPSLYLKDLYSQAYAATFDEFDNLYIADLNRGRVLIYKTPIPTISILQPNSGETLTVGQTYPIKWNSTTFSLPKISLQLISDHNPDIPLVNDTENTGSYNWNVTSDNLSISGAKFKIHASSTSIYGYTVSDDSDDYFFLNHLPTISTTTLPVGQVGQPYKTSVDGSDPDSLDQLSMIIEGISNYGLTYTCQQTSAQIQCNISGTPTSPASSPVPILVSLSDNHTGTFQKTLSLIIKPLPDLTVTSISRSTSGVAIGLCNSGGPINKTFTYTIAGSRSPQEHSLTLDENTCQKSLIACSPKGDNPCKWSTITAVVDSEKVVSESNESNNSLKVPLCQPKPECPVTDRKRLCISPTPPAIGWCP